MPGGRVAGYVIHTSGNLTPAQVIRASELGPTQVTALAPPAALALTPLYVKTLLQAAWMIS